MKIVGTGRRRILHRYCCIMRLLASLLFATVVYGQQDQFASKAQRGKELMSQGRFAEAVPIYDELVRALPTNTGLRLNLALALRMAGRQDDAVPQFERVLKADPNSVPALISLGMAHLERDDPAGALPLLEKVVTLQPADADSRGMLANALLSLDRAKEALPHFRRLTQTTPQDPKAWFGLGRTYEALAGDAFQELSKTAEGSAEWLVLVAESRLAQRQYRAAFYFYRQAIEKQPGMRGVHAALAGLYRATNHADWAALEDRAEAALPPPNCIYDKPECDYKAGRFQDASVSTSPYWRTRADNQLALDAFTRLAKLPESVELH